MKKSKRFLAFATTLILLLCFCVSVSAAPIGAVEQYTREDGSTLTILSNSSNRLSYSAEQDTVYYRIPLVAKKLSTEEQRGESVTPYANPERNKVKTYNYAIALSSDQIALSIENTVRGVWSQADGYAIINSVDITLSGPLAIFFYAERTISGNTAVVEIVDVLDPTIKYMRMTYTLYSNGHLDDTVEDLTS